MDGRAPKGEPMMKPDRTVLQQTGRLAAGIAVLAALMLAVYAILGRFSPAVLGGALFTSVLGVANFYAMGLTVQDIADRAAEKQRDEAELAEFSKQMENRMRLSRNLRMIALFGLVVVGIKVFGFDPLASILPIAFPTVVIRVLQIIDIKKSSAVEGSEKS